MSSARPALRLTGVSKTYAAAGAAPVAALRGVHLEVRRGAFVSLVGPSGCGKSTLLGLIAGLDEPSAGSIEIAAGAAAGASGVAYMPQRDLLLPWRTVMQNATLGAEVGGGDRAQARRRARELLPAFGLDGFENALPHTLSGGMRQRAALLRTVLLGRPLLLLDEPFGALDALTRGQMQEWLLEVWARLAASVLFVTHDVEEAVWLSDRVYVMTRRPGRVKLSVDVDLPRPRERRMRAEPAFAAVEQRLLEALLAEAGEPPRGASCGTRAQEHPP